MSDAPPTSPVPIITANAEQSDDITALAAALAKAQAAMSTAQMSAVNPGYQNKPYADLSDVWEACRGPITANGLSVVQLPRSDGQKITVRTKLLHSSGQWIQTDLTAAAQQNTPQAVGSVITYLRRYSLAAIVGVAPKGDDDDGESGEGRGQARPAAARQAPASKPATQTAPTTGTALPPPATIPEAVIPFAKRFDEVTSREDFEALYKSTSDTFDSGTAEKKAYVVAVKRAMVRLGIEPKKPAATGATP